MKVKEFEEKLNNILNQVNPDEECDFFVYRQVAEMAMD